MTELPPSLEYGFVAFQLLFAVGDTTTDPDRQPDAVPASGTVKFTPVDSVVRATGAANRVTVVKDEITCSLDPEGYLIDPAGARNVALVTGTYVVSYSIPGFVTDAHELVVLSTHTNESPYDLTDALFPV